LSDGAASIDTSAKISNAVDLETRSGIDYPLPLFLDYIARVRFHRGVVFGVRDRHVFLAFGHGFGAKKLLKTRRRKNTDQVVGSFPVFVKPIHVSAGMNTVAPAWTTLTTSPKVTVAVPFCMYRISSAPSRATYTNISANDFTWRGEHSTEGKSWTEFKVIECQRSER
jgi:hypothetical protein